MVESLANLLAEKITGGAGLPRERIPFVAYGLEVIMGGIIKSVCFIAIPWLCGVLPQTLVAVSSAALLRYFSGGAHCTSLFRCLTSTLTIFTAAGLAAKNLALNIDIKLIILVAMMSLLIVIRYAPGDNPNRLIESKREKIIFKVGSAVVVLIYLGVMALVNCPLDLKYALLFGIVIQLFTITGWGYGFMGALDKLLAKGGVDNA